MPGKAKDAREVFIIACLLVPIIGIGLYPKVVTQIYDSTTNQLTALMRNSVPSLVQEAYRPSSPYSLLSAQAPEIELTASK